MFVVCGRRGECAGEHVLACLPACGSDIWSVLGTLLRRSSALLPHNPPALPVQARTLLGIAASRLDWREFVELMLQASAACRVALWRHETAISAVLLPGHSALFLWGKCGMAFILSSRHLLRAHSSTVPEPSHNTAGGAAPSPETTPATRAAARSLAPTPLCAIP